MDCILTSAESNLRIFGPIDLKNFVVKKIIDVIIIVVLDYVAVCQSPRGGGE